MGTLIQFFKDSWSEIRKVSWPKTDDLIKHTVNVVIFVVIFAALTTVIDYGMKTLYSVLPAANNLPTTTQSTAPVVPTDVQTTTTSGTPASVPVAPTTTPATTPSK